MEIFLVRRTLPALDRHSQVPETEVITTSVYSDRNVESLLSLKAITLSLFIL